MKDQLIKELDEFLSFALLLEDLNDEIWFSPIGEGKWRIHDVVTHMMKWDEYFNEVTYPLIARSGFAELSEHPDYLGFNEQSMIYGQSKSKSEILEETIRNRRILKQHLEMLDEKAFSKVYLGDRGFTLESYLKEFFTSHDKHHMKQIQNCIRSL